ncbi:hypothetical protein [Sphingomonas hankyongi]|uniref:DUF883 domain-containing protein n=1 Tax=Sphingomonas hankyongi TaxID=2908209 RepID=A0ABT0S485_9SPHN|nr:hypothetical protein [Sphingomonas hankyongi]MCL6730416.1 hypothetical protein [Sphingomonas hankyongi]
MIQQAGDDRNDTLPDGTDTVIEGAANTGSIATDRESDDDAGTITVEDTASAGSSSGTALADRLRSGREQLSSQAGERARGLVTQGLERTSEALANVSRMVGDTADGIEERLGAEYGDYARRAAGAIENVANTIAEKDPDELIEDTRNFIRNSPGIALAGAAVVGFVVARLVKSGLGSDNEDDDEA